MVCELERVLQECDGFYMQHISDLCWCSTVVTVVSQTSYFVSALYFDRKPMK